MVVSSVTPPATSPTYPKGRRDSTTQCGRKNRRDSRVGGVSPDRAPRLSRLQRQVIVKFYIKEYLSKHLFSYQGNNL